MGPTSCWPVFSRHSYIYIGCIYSTWYAELANGILTTSQRNRYHPIHRYSGRRVDLTKLTQLGSGWAGI